MVRVLLAALLAWAGVAPVGMARGDDAVPTAVPVAAPLELELGGTVVRVPAPEGYVRLSERDPERLDAMRTLGSPANRVVEVLVHADDLARMQERRPPARMVLQVQVLKRGERDVFSPRRWAKMRADLIAEMAELQRVNAGVAMGTYGDDPESVRQWMWAPNPTALGTGGTVNLVAITRLERRVVYLVGMHDVPAQDTGLPEAQRAFDAFVDATLRVNR
jgi:hypothetical protein